jgi:hypothetical protein
LAAHNFLAKQIFFTLKQNAMKTYTFIKTDDEWFIDLPEYIEQGGNPGDLQMVDGADTMLDVMANGNESVSLTLDTKPFEGADELVLTEKCDPFIGGGYYLIKTYRGQEMNRSMWLCQVTEFVFGDLPARIFVRQED